LDFIRNFKIEDQDPSLFTKKKFSYDDIFKEVETKTSKKVSLVMPADLIKGVEKIYNQSEGTE